MSLRRLAGIVLAASLTIPVLATSASAGDDIATIHKLKLQLRAMYEVDRDGGGTREKRSYVYGRDIASACLGRKAESHERLGVTISCFEPDDATIWLVNYEDENLITDIGYMEIISEGIVETNSNGDNIRGVSFLAYLDIECEGEGYETDVELQVPMHFEIRNRDDVDTCVYRGLGRRATGYIEIELGEGLDINGIIRKGRVEVGKRKRVDFGDEPEP